MAKKSVVKKKTAKKVNARKPSVKKASVKTTTKKKKMVSKTIQTKKVESTTTSNVGAQSMIGHQVPSFKCLDSNGNTFDLSKQKGRKTVLYFYPKDDTPGCTIEGKEFSDLHEKFQKFDTDVFGISRDSVKSHDKFKCKYHFQFELLSDEDEAICKIFGVIKEKNMYGKMVLGIERSTFILDENLKVIYEERKVKAEGHAALILERVAN